MDETGEDKRRYDEEVNRLNSFREELITIFHKSQDSFEKQLSFVSAGALALSVAFIKDIVQPFKDSAYKGLLGWGWGLLVLTLLLNCISHQSAARNANKTIKEINEGKYDPEKPTKRNRGVVRLNLLTIITMIIGIGLIMSYIIFNTLL
jgi:hypothetical protein